MGARPRYITCMKSPTSSQPSCIDLELITEPPVAHALEIGVLCNERDALEPLELRRRYLCCY